MGRKAINNIRKPQILEHFRQVVNEEGIHKASIAKIARKMKVSPNLILHYFGSKDAMMMELFDMIMEQYFEYVRMSVNAIPAGPLRLKKLLQAMFAVDKTTEMQTENTYYAYYYLCLFDEKIKARFNQTYRELTEMIVREIECGAGPDSCDSEETTDKAEFVLALYEGFLFRASISLDKNYIRRHGQFFLDRATEFLKCNVAE